MEKINEIIEMIKVALEKKRFNEVKELLEHLEAFDIATLMYEFEMRDLIVMFRLLPKDLAAEVFVELDSDYQEKLISTFSDRDLKEIFDELYLDDTVDILEEMPANVVKRILKNSDAETRRWINELLNYPDDSAGSIMTIEYVRLRTDMTVKEAFSRIRREGVEKETVYTCYVTDSERHLIGVITVLEMLLADENTVIGEIMTSDVISVATHEDKEVVANKFKQYDFFVLPVVDAEGRLVGIATIDDAVDVIVEESTEDIEKMAAITPSEKPYLKTSAFSLFLARIPWILILMVSATFTGLIITEFESALAAQATLTAFIPMIMGTAGNTGSQASVTVIRALSLNDIGFSDIFRVQWKELRVSVLCGLTLAVFTFAKIMLFENLIMGQGVSTTVSLIVSLTLAFTVVCAKFVGCTLPLLAKKLGFDPVVMASPFITTIVDAVSLVIYFVLATSILKL